MRKVRSFSLPLVLPNGNQVMKQDYRIEYDTNEGYPLDLSPNYLKLENDRLLFHGMKQGSGGAWAQPATASIARNKLLPPALDQTRLNNAVRAKFAGKLRKGGAALGVTLASWKQTRSMIVDKGRMMRRGADQAFSALRRDKERLKRVRQQADPLAGQVLEGFFGWVPLVGDVSALMSSAISDPLPDGIITARHRVVDLVKDPDSYDYPWLKLQGSWSVQQMGTLSARVRVENPNLWLLNRLGLINLPAIAWDLVPWSFLVNMVTNLGTIVSSFTDEVGLEIMDRNYTRTVQSLFEQKASYPTNGSGYSSMHLYKYKLRTVGYEPPLSLQFRVPEVNWQLAAIAISLVVQRVDRINRLVKVL